MSDFIKKGSILDRWLEKKLDVKDYKPRSKQEIIDSSLYDRLDSIEDTLKQLIIVVEKLIQKK